MTFEAWHCSEKPFQRLGDGLEGDLINVARLTRGLFKLGSQTTLLSNDNREICIIILKPTIL